MDFAPILGQGKTITLRALYGIDAEGSCDQDGLADSSINYTTVAYQTCRAHMFYRHSARPLGPLTAVSALQCNITG